MFLLHEVSPNRSVGTLNARGGPTSGLGLAAALLVAQENFICTPWISIFFHIIVGF